MLGPASNHPPGTAHHALCLGNELDYKTHRFLTNIEDVLPLIRNAFAATPRPWEVWPEGESAGDADTYFVLCTGYSYTTLYAILKLIDPQLDLPCEG